MEQREHQLINRRARVYLDVIASITGKYGFTKILELAGLHPWLEELPSYNEAREVDFADFSALNIALHKIYGPRTGQAISARAGRALFLELRPSFVPMLDVHDAAFKTQLPRERVRAVLEAMVNGNLPSEGLSSLHIAGEQFVCTITPCPLCWGHNHETEALCHGMVGFLQQAVEWVGAGDEYYVEEASCAATKEAQDSSCVFVVLKIH